MNEVCYSAKNAFKRRFDETQSACSRADHQHAIYGTADYTQSIMVNQKGIRPNCSSGLIIESEEKEGLTGRDGKFLRREYSLTPVGIEYKMQDATRDELDLFLVLANPKILNNEAIQTSFFDRLSTIQKEESVQKVLEHTSDAALREQHNEETEQYSEFFGLFQGAVENPSHRAFYPKGYTPETQVLPEEN